MDGVIEQVSQGGFGEEAFLHIVVTIHSQRELPGHHGGEEEGKVAIATITEIAITEERNLMFGRGLASMIAGSQESSKAIPPATISFGQFVTARLSRASACATTT